MTEALEQLLLAALAPLAQAPTRATLRAGPSASPERGPAICVLAARWTLAPAEGADRPSPHLAARLQPTPGPTPNTWLVSGATAEQVAQVCLPDGRALSRGDDWTLEAASDGAPLLRLGRALAPGASPVVWVRGALARGYESRSRASFELHLSAWGASAAAADGLMGAALGLALPALVDLSALEAPWTTFPRALPAGSGVRARLESPEVSLRELSRRWEPGSPGLAVAEASLELQGDLEMTVAVGAPEPSGVISRVLGQVGAIPFQILGGEAAPAAVPAATRLIGLVPIEMMLGIGDATRARLEDNAGVRTLLQVAQLTDAEIQSIASSSSARNLLVAARARARATAALRLPPLPASLLNRPLSSLADATADGLRVELEAAGLTADAQPTAAALVAVLDQLRTTLRPAWFSGGGATLGALFGA